MRKIIIVCILAVAVFAGCARATSYTESRNPAAESEPNITEAKNDMDKEFEDKVNAIDEIGQEVIENIRTEASKAISQIQSVAETAMKTTMTTEPTTTTTIPEPKEVALDVESESEIGVLRFTHVNIDYRTKTLKFKYDLKVTINPFPGSAICADNKGTELKQSAFGIGQEARRADGETERVYTDGILMFCGFPDFSDLSTVTLTYAFEGYEPVTVTFDIPV